MQVTADIFVDEKKIAEVQIGQLQKQIKLLEEEEKLKSKIDTEKACRAFFLKFPYLKTKQWNFIYKAFVFNNYRY